MRFWLDKGVDGFRLDIINAIFEDPQFKNNPFTWKILPSNEDPRAFFQNPKYTRDQSETLEFVKKLRSLVDEFEPSKFLVGEVYASLPILKKYLGENNDGLNLVFLFQAMDIPLKANRVRNLIKRFENKFPNPSIPTWVFSNHDRMRRITKFNDDINKGKLNATLQLTVRGVPFIYYGEEIGMTQHHLTLKKALDPLAVKYKWIPKVFLSLFRKFYGESLNRDECRTPMQWDDSPNAGFCSPSVEPWLPVNPTHTDRNVETEINDPDSLLNCYKRLLNLRRKYPSLNSGNLELLDLNKKYSDSLVGYVRSINTNGTKEAIHVYLNFTKRTINFKFLHEDSKLLFSTLATRNSIEKNSISFNAFEGIILLLSDN
jgi:oligo-1,6-glucosidase/alpha-glucosidase